MSGAHCRQSVLSDAQNSERSISTWRRNILRPPFQRFTRPCGDDGSLLFEANPAQAQVLLLLPTCSFRNCPDSRRCSPGRHSSFLVQCYYLLDGWSKSPENNVSWLWPLLTPGTASRVRVPVLHFLFDHLDSDYDHLRFLPVDFGFMQNT